MNTLKLFTTASSVIWFFIQKRHHFKIQDLAWEKFECQNKSEIEGVEGDILCREKGNVEKTKTQRSPVMVGMGDIDKEGGDFINEMEGLWEERDHKY